MKKTLLLLLSLILLSWCSNAPKEEVTPEIEKEVSPEIVEYKYDKDTEEKEKQKKEERDEEKKKIVSDEEFEDLPPVELSDLGDWDVLEPIDEKTAKEMREKEKEEQERIKKEKEEAEEKERVKILEKIYKNWAVFSEWDSIENIIAFVENSWEILFTPEDPELFEKMKYKKYEITINETTLTWCDWGRLAKNPQYKKYYDRDIACEPILHWWEKKEDQRWFKITIPWWKYEAYLPVWEYITHCSTTNPIVCWNEDYDEDTVKWYYDEHKKCPWRMIYYAEWTAWPWDYCVISLWSCYNRSKLDCWFNWIKKRFEVDWQYDVAQYVWIKEEDI